MGSTLFFTAAHLLLLFDRPNEPVFLPKGPNNTMLDIPLEYMTDKYKPNAKEILDRFREKADYVVPIKRVTIPDLSVPMLLDRGHTFSVSQHARSAETLTTILMEQKSPGDLMSLATYCRDRLNLPMFFFAFAVTLLHRPDTRHLKIPQFYEYYPSFFLDNSIFGKGREAFTILPPNEIKPIEISIDYTGSKNNTEQRLAFWREDLGINLFHWHWHLLYPIGGPIIAVDKDRRGEGFYYMHHQIMTRYNAERLAHGLPLTKPLSNLREPIAEGYYPKLDRLSTGKSWAGRPDNFPLSDIDRWDLDRVRLSLSTVETWKARIDAAVKADKFVDVNGKEVPLNASTGINVLGNVVDANEMGVNKPLYGTLHSAGHVTTSYIHDPKGLHLELSSVMNPTSTSMRDPVFYRWHAFIDTVFYSHIYRLKPYTPNELTLKGVEVTGVSVATPGNKENLLKTHWSKSDINLRDGFDYTPRIPIYARIQHLNHEEFTYKINVNNNNKFPIEATVRIFIAPKVDVDGKPFAYNQQRELMTELDHFVVKLKKGKNTVTRSSLDTPVTVPYESTFVGAGNYTMPPPGGMYCGCGWPHHMLVPKGTAEGYEMDLFVMLSNHKVDKIPGQVVPDTCARGWNYCGLSHGLKYPDTRAMGYPFDRLGNVEKLTEFLTPNMGLQTVTIKFEDVVKPVKKNNAQAKLLGKSKHQKHRGHRHH